jgi:photosystem II protein
MNAFIQFFPNIKEKTLPLIKLTKSKNGKTGTATFIFIQPSLFNSEIFLSDYIYQICLISNEKKIVSRDINIFFRDGKPFLIKAIFIFKNSVEWFNFLTFMNLYSQETGLFFSQVSDKNK